MKTPLVVSFVSPLSGNYRISSGYGDPRVYGRHEGIDLVPTDKRGGGAVRAIASGTVSAVGYQPEGYGYYVWLDHGDGWKSLYAHLRTKPAVKVGDKIGAGGKIGEVGNTGNSSGTHLHLSIEKNGMLIDPASALPKRQKHQGGGGRDYYYQDDPSDKNPCGELSGSATSEEKLAWAECVRDWIRSYTTDPAALPDKLKQFDDWFMREVYPLKDGGINDPLGMVPAFNAVFEGVYLQFINAVTWPARIYVNTLSLSDEPLTSGVQTVEWLREPEHQKIYFASQIALVIAILFILIALASFLREPAETAVNIAAPQAAAIKGLVKK